MKLVSLALALALTTSGFAQTTPFTDPANLRGERVRPRDGRELPIDGGGGNTALALQQLLRRLNTRASILNIVAHPDDEDGGMLTYYSRGLGARVADLSLTRGEGGQNAITGDFEDALGLLRTQELLANDRYVGVDQMFGTEVDFGFSKTKSEAFAKWTHDRVLYDAVRAVRLYRPLVITSTWIGSVTDGHGQHQVSGQIAQEAFLKAGDQTVFPEMIAEGILPWQPLRVYARVPQQAISEKGLFDYATGQFVAPTFTNYVTGEVTTMPPSTDVIVHEGLTDAILTAAAASIDDLKTTHFDAPAGAPLTYVQFARIGLGLQRSQIPTGFRMPSAGTYDVPYHLYGQELQSPAPARMPSSADPNFFTGIDTSVRSLAELLPIGLTEVRAQIVALDDEIKQATTSYNQDHDIGHLRLLLMDLLNRNAGTMKMLELAKVLPAPKATLLHELRIKQAQLSEAFSTTLDLHFDATVAKAQHDSIEAGRPMRVETFLKFSELPRLDDASLSQPAITVTYLSLEIDGAPAATCPATMKPTLQKDVPLKLTLQCSTVSPPSLPYFQRSSVEQPTYDLVQADLRNASQAPGPVIAWANLHLDGTGWVFDFRIGRIVHEPDSQQPIRIVPAAASLRERVRAIGYDDLPRMDYLPRQAKTVSLSDLKLPTKRRIAYLPGTGDAVPEAMASVGLAPTILSVTDLTAAKLAKFDTVVLGVRTYAAHPDLHGAPTQALLDYAKSGGNVVVQYQTAEFTGADAPYPLTLGRDAEKVVDETAPVKLLLPAQPGTAPGGIVKDGPSPTPTMEYALLNAPNVITSADFNGWVEERGHGFLRTWDPHYAALTETNDPGSKAEGVLPQEPQRGGLITTPLGRGRWTYCAFAIYRQLPEAVPGAYRLFLNLINP